MTEQKKKLIGKKRAGIIGCEIWKKLIGGVTPKDIF